MQGIRVIGKITERPEDAPAIGDIFELSYPASMNDPREKIWTYRVTGWHLQENSAGEYVSVRCHPVDVRYRNMSGMRQCDMGHFHPVYDGEPAKDNAPFSWGFGSKDEE